MVSSRLPACKCSSDCYMLGGGLGAARATPFPSKVRSLDLIETFDFKMLPPPKLCTVCRHDRMASRWPQRVDTHLFSNSLETFAW